MVSELEITFKCYPYSSPQIESRVQQLQKQMANFVRNENVRSNKNETEEK